MNKLMTVFLIALLIASLAAMILDVLPCYQLNPPGLGRQDCIAYTLTMLVWR